MNETTHDFYSAAAFSVPAPLEQQRMVEAVLFASSGPMTSRQIAERLPEGCDVTEALLALRDAYAARGVQLVRVGEGWARCPQNPRRHARGELGEHLVLVLGGQPEPGDSVGRRRDQEPTQRRFVPLHGDVEESLALGAGGEPGADRIPVGVSWCRTIRAHLSRGTLRPQAP